LAVRGEVGVGHLDFETGFERRIAAVSPRRSAHDTCGGIESRANVLEPDGN